MKIIKNPQTSDYAAICARPVIDLASLNETVSTVLADIKARGDEAVKEYEKKFDKAELSELLVSQEEIDAAMAQVDSEVIETLKEAELLRKLAINQIELINGIIKKCLLQCNMEQQKVILF